DNFERLVEALDTGDAEDAFQSAHALKGICENLCLDNVTEVAVPVLEALRTGDISLAKQNFEPLEESYKEVLWRIDELD
ncbi:MAG: Hpt domain-containing protein, partial [Lachnospiraceae bacterium]|nr:Hpt domain-containing protein [Lachnospiraceae bacterium]